MDWIGRWKLSDVGYLAFFGKTKSNRSVECVRKSKRVTIAIRAGYTHRNDEDVRRLVLDSDMSDVVDEVETLGNNAMQNAIKSFSHHTHTYRESES